MNVFSLYILFMVSKPNFTTNCEIYYYIRFKGLSKRTMYMKECTLLKNCINRISEFPQKAIIGIKL